MAHQIQELNWGRLMEGKLEKQGEGTSMRGLLSHPASQGGPPCGRVSMWRRGAALQFENRRKRSEKNIASTNWQSERIFKGKVADQEKFFKSKDIHLSISTLIFLSSHHLHHNFRHQREKEEKEKGWCNSQSFFHFFASTFLRESVACHDCATMKAVFDAQNTV